MNYCLLTGGPCPHRPISIEPNRFFIAEPYDQKREEREKAIKEAIKGYSYIIADHRLMNIALTCKICQQIQSAQFGIVDISNFNENVLIELGMLYGFNKPVVILVEDSEKIKFSIPSNIVGIEQIRYKDFNDLAKKLTNVLPSLFELWERRNEYFIDLKPIIEDYITQLELALEVRSLLNSNFEGTIVDFKIINEVAIAIIDKGTDHGVKKGMFFKVYQRGKRVMGECIEEDVGLLVVRYPQRRISQCQPVLIDKNKPFWNEFFAGSIPDNVIRPYLHEPYERMTEEEIYDIIDKLKIIQKGYNL